MRMPAVHKPQLDPPRYKIRASISMQADDWAILDRFAKASPWRGNRSAWLRDHVRALGTRNSLDLTVQVDGRRRRPTPRHVKA